MIMEILHTRYRRMLWRSLLVGGLLLATSNALLAASSPVKLGGVEDSIGYVRAVLTQALADAGHDIQVEMLPHAADIPMTRQELMLQRGEIGILMLGQTAERDRKFLPVAVGMTGNLVNHRILFIPKGHQHRYDSVQNLQQFRQLGKVAAMGEAWGDRAIWEQNGLPLETVSGNWRKLYRMVASTTRGMAYLPRGAHEMSQEWMLHPELDVEQHLAFVYERDHILYVAPGETQLQRQLYEVLSAAQSRGVIRQLSSTHFAAVFEPPVNLHKRRLILLETGMP